MSKSLDHIFDLYGRKGGNFVRDLISKEVTVTVKVDSAAFSVMNDNGKLRFFGRHGKTELDDIKRASSNLWEGAIGYIEEQPWQKLPNGVLFFFEMFNPNLKTIIKYSRFPQSSLVLLYAQKGETMFHPGSRIVQNAAKLLKTDAPPIIFQGRLSNAQKEKIVDFASSDEKTRQERYGMDNFTNMIFDMFDIPEDQNWLVKDGLEGLVFYFGSSSEAVSYKMVDPLFTQRIKQKMADNADDENYGNTIARLAWKYAPQAAERLLAKEKLKYMELDSRNQQYISFIASLVGMILNMYGNEIKRQVAEYEESAEASRFSQLGYSRIPQGVERMKKKFWFSEDIFRILLLGLNKKKIRANKKLGIDSKSRDSINSILTQLEQRGLV